MGTAISVFIFRLSRCAASRLSVLSSSENAAVSADTGGGALRTASPELSIVSTSSLSIVFLALAIVGDIIALILKGSRLAIQPR